MTKHNIPKTSCPGQVTQDRSLGQWPLLIAIRAAACAWGGACVPTLRWSKPTTNSGNRYMGKAGLVVNTGALVALRGGESHLAVL